VLDHDGQIRTVVLAELVQVLDEVVGHLVDRNSIWTSEQKNAVVHHDVGVVHDPEDLVDSQAIATSGAPSRWRLPRTKNSDISVDATVLKFRT